ECEQLRWDDGLQCSDGDAGHDGDGGERCAGVGAQLLASGVSDADANASKGIAITAIDASADALGDLYYSVNNGQVWTAVPALNAGQAFLLAADSANRLFFKPTNAAVSIGTLQSIFTFRAWDQTSGVSGTLASVSITGSDTAFSTQFDTASIDITLNSQPDFTGLASTKTVVENAQAELLDADVSLTDLDSFDFDGGSIAVNGVGSNDRISLRNSSNVKISGASPASVEYSADSGSTWIAVGTLAGGEGNDLLISLNDKATAAIAERIIESLMFFNDDDDPQVSRTLVVSVSDGDGGIVSQPISVTITALDDVPTITGLDGSLTPAEQAAATVI
ncbi:MAG: hypothetical protein EB069_11910, partial [Actinobacteria bacterium]|nr:hypothetical protein [Actinomycetota bacterium]